MKKICTNLMMLLATVAALVSCNESGDKIYLDGFKASELMASASDVTLSVDNSADIVLAMAWQNPTLLSSDDTKPAGNGVLTTTLQAAVSTDFATVKEYSVTERSKAFTGADLNALAKDLGMAADQHAPLYFRIKSQMGANLDAAYSNVCQVNVTPFTIHMNTLTILNGDKNKTLATLYSPEENGIYTGYMNASGWLNFWAQENDGTMWGNSSTDGTFVIDNTTSAWNCWFPGVAAIYYTVVDTKAKEWKATAITGMTVGGIAMSYDTPNRAWVGVIATLVDNTPISIVATGAEYNKSTDTNDDAAVAKTLNYTLADGQMTDASTAGSVNIAAAGIYTVTVMVGDNSQLTYTIEEGDKTTPEAEAKNTLCMFTKDGSTLLAVMEKVSDGIYTCKYKPSAWENFYFIYVGESKDDKQTWYGCEPVDGRLFYLSSGTSWNLWFQDDANGETEFTVTVDLNTMTWKYE